MAYDFGGSGNYWAHIGPIYKRPRWDFMPPRPTLDDFGLDREWAVKYIGPITLATVLE